MPTSLPDLIARCGDLGAPDAVYRIWRARDRVELEAADCFSRLATDIRALRGPDDAVAQMAAQAAEDEKRHSALCRLILSTSSSPIDSLAPELGVMMGPPSLVLADRILYTAVAIGCVTETLSTALLIEMRKVAGPSLIRGTVHEILEDEISHSRLGWAELALAARTSDVSWLSAFVPGMIRDAIRSDIKPMVILGKPESDLSRWGILPIGQAQTLMHEAIEDVILPGLMAFGVKTP